jgi:hypothetical protein
MDKLARFQLEDPHQYVLELVAAAVCAGASSVQVRNDADDLEMSWDGDHPTRDELDSLFDWVFSRDAKPRSRMLRHLAQGVFGALGLDPKWVRVERPGLTWDFTDPAKVATTPNDRTQGVHVHVRERLGMAVVGDALVMPRETRLLQSRAGVCPVPIQLGGKEISGGPSDRPRKPPTRHGVETEGHHLWLTTWRAVRSDLASFPARTGTVALIRDGILVGWMTLAAGPLYLAGWVAAQDLKLNASLSAPVEDAAWDKVQGQLFHILASSVTSSMSGKDQDIDDEELRSAALDLYARDHGRALLEKAPLFRDLNDRLFSPRDLRNRKVYILRMLDLADPTEPTPQFAAFTPPEPDSTTAHQAECLDLFRTKPGDSLFLARRNGRHRRQLLARQVTPLEHGASALMERVFEGEGLRGTVAIPLDDPGGDVLQVELRVEGLPVETVYIQVTGPLTARVASDALTATPDFQKVERDRAYKDAIERAKKEAGILVVAAAQQHPSDPRVRRLLYNWLRRVKISKSRRKQGRLVPPLPASIVQAPLFTEMSGEERSLDFLRGGGPANKEILRTAIRHVSPNFRAFVGTEGVLRLDEPARRALRHLLPRPLKEVRQELIARAEAERRRATDQRHPVLGPGVLARAKVAEEGFTGEVGLVDHPKAACWLDVIHDGVLLCTLEVPDAPVSTAASLDIPGVEPTLGWNGVRDEAALLEQVGPVLRAALGRLIVAQAQKWDPHLPLPGWLWPYLASAPWPEELTSLPLFPTAGEELLTFDQVAEREDIWWSPERVGLRGLEDVLVLDPTRQRALECLADRLKPASKLIEELRRGRGAFFSRKMQDPVLPDSLHFCGRTPISGDGVRGEAGVIDGPEARPGLHIAYRHLRRGLCSESLPFPVPVQIVLDGPAVRPNPRFDGLEHSVDVASLHAIAQEAALEATAAALAAFQRGYAPLFALRAALDPENPDLVPPEALVAARSAPMFPLVGSERASLDALLEDMAADRVRAVPRRFAEVEPPPGDRRWLVADKLVREVFSLVGEAAVPDGTADLERWLKGQERRGKMAWQPFVPENLEASATVLHRQEDRQVFLALLSGPADGLVVAWYAEGRIVRTAKFRCPVAVHAVVTAEGLRGDEAFENPVPEELADTLADEARALVPDLLLAAARALEQPSDSQSPLPAVILHADGVRAALVRWGASKRRKLAAEWAEIPVFLASTGERISLPAVFGAAKRKRLRVVGPQCRGRPLDPKRPVLVVERDEVLYRVLDRFFELQWVEEALAREEAAWQRREALPRPWLQRPPRNALLTLSIPEGCEGYLAVFSSGASSVTLHVGWRELETIGAPGPVPLSGHLSDDKLQWDSLFTKAVGPSRKRIVRALEEASTQALDTLLKDPDLVADRALWLRILRRSFEDREALLASPEGGVADLPLFETGDWRTLSAREVAAAKRVRWVLPGRTLRSLDPNRPFVRATVSERQVLGGVLPGYTAQEEALEETEIWKRRRGSAAFRLPHRTWIAQLEAETSGLRLLLGLDRALDTPGRMVVRCASSPIEERDLDHLGVYAIVEVPERQVDPGWRSADLTREQDEAVEDQIATLFRLAADTIRSRARARRRLCRILARLVALTWSTEFSARGHVAAWLTAPLLELPNGVGSLHQVAARLRSESAVVWGKEPVDEALVLLASRSNEALLASVGLAKRVQPVHRWRQRRERAQREQRAAEAAKAARIALEELQRCLRSRTKTLLTGLEAHIAVLDEARTTWERPGDTLWSAALEDPSGPASWLVSWRSIDAVLVAAGRFEDATEVAVRVAERVAMGSGDS